MGSKYSIIRFLSTDLDECRKLFQPEKLAGEFRIAQQRLPGSFEHASAILDDTGNKRRYKRRMKRMEAHARLQLGIPGSADVDWADKTVGGSIDWKSVMSELLKILVALLPLLLAL